MVLYDHCWNSAHGGCYYCCSRSSNYATRPRLHSTSRGCSCLRRSSTGNTGQAAPGQDRCAARYAQAMPSVRAVWREHVAYHDAPDAIRCSCPSRSWYVLVSRNSAPSPASPLEQLPSHWSGVSILPDLTVADPFYALPISAAVLMNIQRKVCNLMARVECPFFIHAGVHHRLAQAGHGCVHGPMTTTHVIIALRFSRSSISRRLVTVCI